jgi:hypothetical protein
MAPLGWSFLGVFARRLLKHLVDVLDPGREFCCGRRQLVRVMVARTTQGFPGMIRLTSCKRIHVCGQAKELCPS